MKDPEYRWRVSPMLGEVDFPNRWVTPVLDLVDRLSPRGARIAMEVSTDGPGFHVGLRGDWPPVEVHEALLEAGFSAATLSAWGDLLGKLLAHRVGGLRIALPSDAGADPRVIVDVPIAFTRDEAAGVQAQVALVAGAVGVGDALSEWMASVIPAFAPHPSNTVEAGLDLTPRRVLPRLGLAYPTIPSRLVLKLATSFGSDPHPGAKLGALVGAATREEDVVDRLELVAGPGEAPEVRFALEAVGPPDLASG